MNRSTARCLNSTLLVLVGVVLAGCAKIAVVSEKPPGSFPLTSGANTVNAQTIAHGQNVERSQPLVALADYISAARESLRALDRQPANVETRHAYNFAVARIFTVVRDAKLDPWSQPLRVGAGGQLTLTWKRDPRPEWNAALYDLVPTDELLLKGSYVERRVIKEGIGAPLVAIRHLTPEQASRNFAPPVIYYSVTGIARFDGSRCVLSIEDPLENETVHAGANTYPLAADFTASAALLLAREHPEKLGLARLLRPEHYAATARVARLEPYNPNKRVLLVIHGLMDTPASWTPMLNDLRSDPEIRRDYQFWFYSYPSGYPYPYSAMILRQELDEIERKYPLRKPMVVVGHSMGGSITRTLVTDTGMTLWLEAFGRPPAEVKIDASSKRLLEDALIFKHRPEIGRVIFLSAPHRGSELAKNFVGRIGSMLVRTPLRMLTIGNTLREVMTADPAALRLKRFPNSVDTLAPNNRFVIAINKLPITPGIPYHTIVGDRGRGDTPKSSDGVVAYWSSHLEGAASERIVPSNHSTPRNPEAIAEVHRILKLNARSR
jgi:pimeloyl-ACP methyl ester carboxylesterase